VQAVDGAGAFAGQVVAMVDQQPDDRTRRVDFALFMVEALENDELATRPRRSSGARRPRRSRTPPTNELFSASHALA
jgi:hypothetical protein